MRRVVVCIILMLASVLVLKASSWAIIPDSVASQPSSNFLDEIFRNKAAIATARLVFLAIGLFIIWSVALLIADGRYITDLGAIKTAASVSKRKIADVESEYQEIFEELNEAAYEVAQENEQLQNELNAVYELLSTSDDGVDNLDGGVNDPI